MIEDVGRWLPIQVDPISLADSLGNKMLYPHTVPVTREDLYLEQALLIEELRKNPQDWYKEGKIIIPPKLQTISATQGEMLLMVLNALEPQGVVEIEDLAVVIAPAGQGKLFQKTIGEAVIDFHLTQKQKMKINYDEIILIPTPEEAKTVIEIKLTSPFKIEGKDKIKIEAQSSKIGIIIDTRGRPLQLPSSNLSGKTRMQKWQKSLESNWNEYDEK